MTAQNTPRAFPSNAAEDAYGGMSLRDWFAGQAMPHALYASTARSGCYNYDAAAIRAYEIADAMLAEGTKPDALAFLSHVAKVSAAVGFQAGVGASEMAGAIISYLAAHPEELGAFMAGGFFDLAGGEPGVRHHVEGCLSWQGMDGAVYYPEEVRAKLASGAKGGAA